MQQHATKPTMAWMKTMLAFAWLLMDAPNGCMDLVSKKAEKKKTITARPFIHVFQHLKNNLTW